MSEIQDASQKTVDFISQVKRAKSESGHTNQSLADATGLSISSVAKLLSGTTADIKLSDAIAYAKIFDLSLDELCGITQPHISDSELREANHALELENEHLRGENGKLAAVDAARMESLATQKPILRGLCLLFVLSIVTTLALLAYLIGDAMHESVGLIQYGEFSKPAIAAIIVIAAALINACLLAYRIYKHGKE